MAKTIYLARHAKSAWDSGAPTDFDRPLSDRGVDDAIRMGRELDKRSWKPEKIIASPALRSQLTCLAYCDCLGINEQEVVWTDDFYAAYMVTLLQSLRALSDSVKSVMLIGHNPAMEDLLLHLCDEQAVQNYYQKNGKLFTTGNVAKISVEGEWEKLLMLGANLEEILRPKAL